MQWNNNGLNKRSYLCAVKYCYSSTSKLPLSTSNSSRLRAGSTLKHTRKHRRAKRPNGKESCEEVPCTFWFRSLLRRARFCARSRLHRACFCWPLLQREPARRVILEMSSAFAVWDVTKTIHVEQITSLTQCFCYYFRKQSVQNRGEKLNYKWYRKLSSKLRNVAGVRSSP